MTDKPTDDDGWGEAAKPAKPAARPEPAAKPKPPAKLEPAAAKPDPAAAKPEPAAAKPKPPPTEPEPAAAKPKPPAAKPEPPAAKPKPPPAKPKPPPAKPEPPPAKPKPAAAKPEPAASSASDSWGASTSPEPAATASAPDEDDWSMPPPSSLRDAVGTGDPPRTSGGGSGSGGNGGGSGSGGSGGSGSGGDDGGKPKRERREWPPFNVLAKRAGIGLGIALIIAGGVKSYINSQELYVLCGDTEVTAERGSWLPPWGTTTLSGKRYAPIPNPPDARCSEGQFDTTDELEMHYLGLLLARADRLLEDGEPEDVDRGEALLEQALLLARDPSKTGPQRRQIDQLQGDVLYWRGKAKIEALRKPLGEAAKALGEAADRGPRHSRDAASWAGFAGTLSGEIDLGPAELRPEQPRDPPLGNVPPTSPRTPGADAGPHVSAPAMDAGVAPAPARPDAGTPAGVLL